MCGLRHGSRILDIAAGTGRSAVPFELSGYRVVALDVAPAMLAALVAKASGLPIPIVVGVREIVGAPEPPVTIREFLASIDRDECSYTWKLPPPVRDRCVAVLVEWSHGRFDLNRAITNPARWKVFLRST